MIANSGHDECGRYSGGKAGDQGGEWVVQNWYKRPWNCILRHPDITVGNKLAELARAAALNDHIGYDQGQRWTFLDQLRKANWEPGEIRTDCEQDCSSGVISLTVAAGHLLGRKELQNANSKATYTGNMRAAYAAMGFKALTENKYIESSRYLLPGDILLNDASHTAINLDTGTSAKIEKAVELAQEEKESKTPLWVGEVTASLLNVRKGPGTGYAQLPAWPMLARGNYIDVCGSRTTADGATWYYIRIAGKYFGYVHSAYIRRVA